MFSDARAAACCTLSRCASFLSSRALSVSIYHLDRPRRFWDVSEAGAVGNCKTKRLYPTPNHRNMGRQVGGLYRAMHWNTLMRWPLKISQDWGMSSRSCRWQVYLIALSPSSKQSCNVVQAGDTARMVQRGG